VSALTVERVLARRPEALASAAGELEPTADGLDQSQHRVRAAGDALGGEWTGPAAAQQRISADTRDAAQLAAAVRSAQSALRSGAGALGGARSDLLGVVHDARGRGFSVANDGSVTPPATPPVMYGTQPGAAQAAQAAYDDALTRAQAEAQRLADAVGTALAAAGRADSATATSLQAVQIPQGLRERVDSFVGRLRDSHDVYAALGKAGGLAVGGKALKDAWKLFSKGKAFGQFLSNSLRAAVAAGPAARFLTGSGEVADAAAFLRFQALMGKADTALGVFRIGRAPTWLVGARTVAGKAFLPLTVVSGLGDVVTGGGYTGARGWATRGFGLPVRGVRSPCWRWRILSASRWEGRRCWPTAPGLWAISSMTTGRKSVASPPARRRGPVTAWATPELPCPRRRTGPAAGSPTRAAVLVRPPRRSRVSSARG